MKWLENLEYIGTDAPVSGRERRKAVRVTRSLEIQYTAAGVTIRGRVSDISEGGLFIDTTNPLEVGTLVHYSFSLPVRNCPVIIKGRARVTWTQHMVGMGIQFLDMSREDRDRIKYWVASEFFGVAADSTPCP